MNEEFDELAQAAAGVLVTALASDSGEAAVRWFAGVIGQERRLSATRAELTAAFGPSRGQVIQSAVTIWAYRLRDILAENPAAGPALRNLVAAQRPAPAPVAAAPRVRDDRPAGAYVGLGSSPQAPVAYPSPPSSPGRKPKGALAAATVVVLAAVAVAGWLAHWPPALFPANSPALTLGISSVSIKSIPTTMTYNSKGQATGPKDSQGDLIAQEEQGTIDGLALTGTGGFDSAQFPLPSQATEQCDGMTGLESSGTLGGIPYHVLMTCVPSAQQYPSDYTQTYTGQWGSLPIHMAGTVNVSTWTPVHLSGTIGTQHVTATITMTAGYPPGEPVPGTLPYNTESGTITVS